MAVQSGGLILGRGAQELQPHGSLEFPCAAYSSHHTERPQDTIPWHWHEELEIIHIQAGRMSVKTPASAFVLDAGGFAVINSNTLHFAAAQGACDLRSLVFSPALVAGGEGSVFARKYIQPLLACPGFSGYPIGPEGAADFACWFQEAFTALMQGQRGYEFAVRNCLSRICLFLYENFAGQLGEKPPALRQDGLRIKAMLDFIHKNYGEHISLLQISGAAGISQRECLRCFKKTIQLSPIQYLLKYRVMQGAELLLADPGQSISEVATSCGFDSPSNFAQTFRRFYGCAPREYRRARQAETPPSPYVPLPPAGILPLAQKRPVR